MTVGLRTDFCVEYDSGVNFLGKLQLIISFLQNSRKIFKVHSSTDQSYGKKHLSKGLRSRHSSAKTMEKSIVEYGKLGDIVRTDSQNNSDVLVVSVNSPFGVALAGTCSVSTMTCPNQFMQLP